MRGNCFIWEEKVKFLVIPVVSQFYKHTQRLLLELPKPKIELKYNR